MAEAVIEAVTGTELQLLKDLAISRYQQESDRRLGRWRVQREAQKLLPDERVAFCIRRMKATSVDVLYSSTRQSAHYGGLMVCGSIWVCPLCAAKISERRRIELEQGIENWVAKGGAVYLATYTISHKRYDDLPSLLKSFLAARKRARQGRSAQTTRKRFGIVGTVSVREVTWSKENGWHPHCHELVFCTSEIALEEYDKVAREQWRRSVEYEGLTINEHGFKLNRTYGGVADYVAKFGREPMKAPWSAATELTKGHLKHGHGEEHLTPFAMLELIAQGRDELKPIFREYARWFKGKHQLVWSSGLRALLLDDIEEKPDIELAQEPEEEEEVLLGQLSQDQWKVVLAKDARGKLLEIARMGDWQPVETFLIDI
ncbi:MAG TPA: hypothetical protein VII61_12870, partial [Ktedonobacteraceae bacterium]